MVIFVLVFQKWQQGCDLDTFLTFSLRFKFKIHVSLKYKLFYILEHRLLQ